MFRMMLIAGGLAILSGCATIDTRTPKNYHHNSFYSGTRQDFFAIYDCCWCLLDLPLSLVGDTLMLPFDTWYYIQTPAEKKP